MATRISMAAKKVPLHMISRGSSLIGAIRPFSSIENAYKKPTSVDYDYDYDYHSSRIATQIDYIAQKVQKIDQIDYIAHKVEKIELQLRQLQRHQRPLEDEKKFNSDPYRVDPAFNINLPPKYHDPKLPEFSAIAKRALDTYNHSQVTKLELIRVALAYTFRGEDNTRILIKAKPCNPATDSDSQPRVIYKGVILSKEEKFVVPIKPAKDLDTNDHQSEVFVHRYKEGKTMCEQTINNEKFSQVGIQTKEYPVDHDLFTRIAQQAIHSYNLGQHSQDSKLELIKMTSAFTTRGNKVCVVIEARTCNTPDIQPVIYKGLVSIGDKKLEELFPMEPGELKL